MDLTRLCGTGYILSCRWIQPRGPYLIVNCEDPHIKDIIYKRQGSNRPIYCLFRPHTWIRLKKLGGQRGLVVKHPSGIQEVGGSNPTAVILVETKKWTLGDPLHICALIVLRQTVEEQQILKAELSSL